MHLPTVLFRRNALVAAVCGLAVACVVGWNLYEYSATIEQRQAALREIEAQSLDTGKRSSVPNFVQCPENNRAQTRALEEAVRVEMQQSSGVQYYSASGKLR